MSKFKVGQRVKCIEARGLDSRRISVGATGTVLDEHWRPDVRWDSDGQIENINENQLALAEPTLDALSVGDVVVSGGEERKVLSVLSGGLIALSWVKDDLGGKGFDCFSSLKTVAELKQYGCTVKTEDPDPEIKELTMDEVAKLVGVPVEQIRIKEGER